jgi:hypothetical protein
MPRTQIQITPADIEACCGYIASYPAAYPLRRPLPTTPGRRYQAILAAGRDAIAYILIDALKLVPNYQALTKAIRAGHQGNATDFDAINRLGAVALGLLEDAQ